MLLFNDEPNEKPKIKHNPPQRQDIIKPIPAPQQIEIKETKTNNQTTTPTNKEITPPEPIETNYNKLTPYHRQCLCATNFWRIVNQLPQIIVPQTDTNYWEYWNRNQLEKKATDLLKQKQQLKNV